ncbi:MAG: hypothetical protein EZS26_000978 [Candidatus Ordinivivax streblomastigis]|uniref:Uncharacterized protein n=1 Tax=Candidatus Ordinivivax streblomastigis TaxID=2540710 RepID=A0A5M8P349_9BACT|nr:MAG: hypothetical protein EZS26_000978 [Candidatus Ordinivivax streblomastigis]
MKSITTAIENLPEELLTPQIVEAGIQEGEIELLNFLPPTYLTADNINRLVSSDKYSWRGFDLARVPVTCRNQAVCDCAVKKSINNYRHVPDKLKSHSMSEELMKLASKNIGLLEFIPEKDWSNEFVYKGICSIYGESSYNYNSRGRGYYSSNESNTNEKMRLIQILLSFAPRKIKNSKFYLGLFTHTKMSGANIQFLIPNKYKHDEYYRLLAGRDFSLIPQEKYSYEIFLSALGDKGTLSLYDVFKKENLKEKIMAVMDDVIADAIMKKAPQYFDSLPKQFQTVSRLLFTIDNHKDYYHYDNLIKDKKLLTKSVCKVLVKLNNNLPVFPDEIWNEDFVKFCMKITGSFYWFEQMPQRLQTQDMVNKAVEYSGYNVQYAHPSFINSHIAMKLYRKDGNLKKYLPSRFFTDFTATTGLPEEFFGGECSFLELKEKRKEYTYCQIGNTYIGFYTDGRYSNSSSFVIMTRLSLDDGQPQVVFNRRVGSFHKTWLEKQIADYDREFEKPAVSKMYKEVQLSPYYGVEPAGVKDDVQIFRNTFRGETVAFVAKRGERIESGNTREEAIEYFHSTYNEMKVA